MQDGFVLTLNAGSSSLKFALFGRVAPPRRVVSGSIEGVGAHGRRALSALDDVISRLEPHGGLAGVAAVGHRIVHGGARLDRSCRVTLDVLAELRRLSPIDPNHLPAELALVDAIRARAPNLRQVACFDTAFHRTLPRVARLVPIARRYEGLGVQRYGFHGLSYTYLVEELARVAGDAAMRGRVVMAHLGSGASLAALREGRAVETTMGFSPTSGIPMGTRSGDVDPGVLLFLLRSQGLTVDALDELLNRESGLRGLSETSSDVRELLAREATDARAAEALAVFCHRARQAVGALAATIGGLDTLVFSGGIGENSAPMRARIAAGLEHLGVRLDGARNDAGGPVISADASASTVRVLRTDEESVIARETLRVLEESPT
ncbi:MAG TPA: acetate/propionate family kinase [Polyangiaceae bacterium]|nr:acetate/propionate family kinase [Polyangiaceae bacterium]